MLVRQDQGAEHTDGSMQPNLHGVVGPTHTCTPRTLQGQEGAWIFVPAVPSPASPTLSEFPCSMVGTGPVCWRSLGEKNPLVKG